MRFKVKQCAVSIEYSFILVLSFCALFNAKDIILMLAYCAVHEFSHLLALVAVGGKADSIKLSFYGVALRYSCRLSRNKELFVILCGPLSNLVMYALFKDEINILLFLVNAMPVYPLDGGRVLDLFSYRASKLVSAVLIVVLCILSVYFIIIYKSFSLLLITAYLIFYSINYY